MATKWYGSKGEYYGPTLADCQRSWDYLTTEYVTDLKIAIDLQTAKEPSFIARVVVWSPGIDPETGGARDHIWATKELQHGYEAITYRQLFDLLIVSHQKIQAVLGGQETMPLP